MKTPQQSYPSLATIVGVPELYIKREDLHKYGSHKGRSIPLMVKSYAKEGRTRFAISSSGNAAIAAVRAVQNHNMNNPQTPISLAVYVGMHVDGHKFARLKKEIQNTRVTVEQVERPKQSVMLLEKEGVTTKEDLEREIKKVIDEKKDEL